MQYDVQGQGNVPQQWPLEIVPEQSMLATEGAHGQHASSTNSAGAPPSDSNAASSSVIPAALYDLGDTATGKITPASHVRNLRAA